MMISCWIILIGFLVGANCSLIGSFLVLRRQAMLGDTLSHTALLGIVLAFLCTNSMSQIVTLAGATIAGVVTILLIGFLDKQVGVSTDVAMAIVSTSFFALGIILISIYADKADLDVGCVLYGQLQMMPFDVCLYKGHNIGPKAVYWLGLLLACNVIFVVLCFTVLFITSFDHTFAKVIGINTKLWHYVLMVLSSITIVVACKAVGAVLVIGLLVIPPATAYLLTNSLPVMLCYALLINALIAYGGYQLAALLNGSIAGATITVASMLFGLAFCIYRYQSSMARAKSTHSTATSRKMGVT